jgi:hypothetical protein
VGGEREEGAGGGRGGERDHPEGAPASGEELPCDRGEHEGGEREDEPRGERRAHVERGGRRGRDDQEAVDPPGGPEERDRAETDVVERCGGAVHAGTMRFRKPVGTPHRWSAIRDVRTA